MAIFDSGLEFQDFISPLYTMESLRGTYFGETTMVSTVDMEELEIPQIEPPVVHRRPGGPKKRRMRSSVEEEERELKCSKCGVIGHNKRTCRD